MLQQAQPAGENQSLQPQLAVESSLQAHPAGGLLIGTHSKTDQQASAAALCIQGIVCYQAWNSLFHPNPARILVQGKSRLCGLPFLWHRSDPERQAAHVKHSRQLGIELVETWAYIQFNRLAL